MTNDNEKTEIAAQGPTQLPATQGQDKWHDAAIAILIFLPILSLALNAISWLRFGLDIPFWDDWRSYIGRGIGTFSLKYLFTPINSTLYPIGLALDSAAPRVLDGNSIAYQFLSMVIVLGLLLLLQWRLLFLALRNRLLAASAFSFSILMLQPGSYWGRQNLAYHQALPVVFNLAAIYIVVGRGWSDRWSIPSLFVLGILSGLSYISGAVSVTAVGAILFIMSHLIEPSERKPLRRGGLSLLAAGFITMVPQIWCLIVERTDRIHTSMAFPYQSDFWLFFLGKIGRSLMLPHKYTGFSIAMTILVVLAVCILTGLIAKRFARGEMRTLSDARTSVVYITTLGGTFVYLLLVAAGRTNLHSPEVITATQIFTLGFTRFHFFWVTLLWPWVAAVCLETISKTNQPVRTGNRLRSIALTLPAVLLPLFIAFGAFGHMSYYRDSSHLRAQGISCLISQIQKRNTLECPTLCPPIERYKHMMEGFIYGKSIGASFTRSIPLLHVPIGTATPAPLFRLSNANAEDLNIRSTASVEKTESGYRFHGDNNPQILFRTGAPESMRQCLALEISALMRVAGPLPWAQISYRIPGEGGLAEKTSLGDPVKADANELVEVSFQLFSPTGFLDDLRFNPYVSKPQEFDLVNIEVRCRISKD